MKMKRKDWWMWYNAQNMTENQIIVMTRISNRWDDQWELIPSLEKFKKTYGEYPQEQVADKWYASEEWYEFMERKGIIWYVPHQRLQIDIKDYEYNKEKNEYEDKVWRKYYFKQNIRKKQEWRWRPMKWKELKADEIKATVYETKDEGNKKYIQINRRWQELCKRNDERLYSEWWREKYKKRSGCVENVFWNIKANLGFERFRLRWIKWAEIEWTLISIAHNLKKLIRYQVAY